MAPLFPVPISCPVTPLHWWGAPFFATFISLPHSGLTIQKSSFVLSTNQLRTLRVLRMQDPASALPFLPPPSYFNAPMSTHMYLPWKTSGVYRGRHLPIPALTGSGFLPLYNWRQGTIFWHINIPWLLFPIDCLLDHPNLPCSQNQPRTLAALKVHGGTAMKLRLPLSKYTATLKRKTALPHPVHVPCHLYTTVMVQGPPPRLVHFLIPVTPAHWNLRVPLLCTVHILCPVTHLHYGSGFLSLPFTFHAPKTSLHWWCMTAGHSTEQTYWCSSSLSHLHPMSPYLFTYGVWLFV